MTRLAILENITDLDYNSIITTAGKYLGIALVMGIIGYFVYKWFQEKQYVIFVPYVRRIGNSHVFGMDWAREKRDAENRPTHVELKRLKMKIPPYTSNRMATSFTNFDTLPLEIVGNIARPILVPTDEFDTPIFREQIRLDYLKKHNKEIKEEELDKLVKQYREGADKSGFPHSFFTYATNFAQWDTWFIQNQEKTDIIHKKNDDKKWYKDALVLGGIAIGAIVIVAMSLNAMTDNMAPLLDKLDLIAQALQNTARSLANTQVIE